MFSVVSSDSVMSARNQGGQKLQCTLLLTEHSGRQRLAVTVSLDTHYSHSSLRHKHLVQFAYRHRTSNLLVMRAACTHPKHNSLNLVALATIHTQW
jgi:hypothetical protein